MKVLLLAGGYGTRLEHDLRLDQSGKWRHLLGVPKPLLPVGKYPLVTYWMKTLENVEELTDIFVVTNDANYKSFKTWQQDWPNVKLVSDGSTSNENRPGSVGCINLAIKKCGIKDDLMIIAGDTLFYDNFKLSDIFQRLEEFRNIDSEANLLVYVDCPEEEVHKHGILETDNQGRVIRFLEKPKPTETSSRKQCPCFYILSPKSFPILNQFLEENKDQPMASRDATGTFITYLYKRKPTFATRVSGRFDVGGLQSYIVCQEYFQNMSGQYKY